ncbi:MAG: gephyrin-like molybdotransferase Glp [Pseudomonadota bacterium]
MKPFFNVQTVEQVRAYAQAVQRLASQEVDLGRALGRSLAALLKAPHDLPGFDRATMDGYAVRGRDTFGASETEPGYLTLTGEVMMGHTPPFQVGPGQCARIGTGGMLPDGADAVVMVEHTRSLDDGSVEIAKSVAPGTHVLGAADDAAAGQALLNEGHCLRPQDLGLLAGLGMGRVAVVRRPRVGIISTGDEVVPVESQPGPGQVRDMNTHTLSAQILQAGGEPRAMGLVKDDEAALTEMVARSLKENDLTLLSGGSSVGMRDFTAQVFMSFPEARMLVHGVAVSPGKPFIWVQAGEAHLIGLPGQVASCMVAFNILVEPILERMLGRQALAFTRFTRLSARLMRNLPSAQGREDYIRVRVGANGDGAWQAEPVFGKSGLIRTLTQGHGLVRIPLEKEGLDQGSQVEVLLFPRS